MALNKLYRDRERGMIAGVCAGLADFFELDVRMTRIVVAVSAFFFPSVILAYIVLALLLKTRTASDRNGATDKPRRRRKKHRRERREGAATTDTGGRDRASPHATLNRVRRRFRDLDVRLQRLEKYVTSERYRLDREFEGLRDGPGSTQRR